VKLTDNERFPVSSDTIGDDEEVDEEAQLQTLRKKFVGEVDLPVRIFMSSKRHDLTNTIIEEPLLKESKC